MSDYLWTINREMIMIFLIIYPFFYYFGKKYIPSLFVARNVSFLVAAFLICLIVKPAFDRIYGYAFVALWVAFNLFCIVSDKIPRKRPLWWKMIAEYLLCFVLLYTVAIVILFAGDYPFNPVIIERFSNGTYSFTPGNWDTIMTFAWSGAFIIVLVKFAYEYQWKKWHEKELRDKKEMLLQKELVQTKLSALEAKVNSHFLYNSLNSIAGLALVDPEKTRRMALALSGFFRYNMNREQKTMVDIHEEMEIIGLYLQIEKIRFGDSLNYKMDIAPDIAGLMIPRMLLQPLVENCVKHGLKGGVERLFIDISVTQDNDTWILSVKDDGAPFEKPFVSGYGLKSLYDKLDFFYPGKYRVEIITEKEKEIKIILNRV